MATTTILYWHAGRASTAATKSATSHLRREPLVAATRADLHRPALAIRRGDSILRAFATPPRFVEWPGRAITNRSRRGCPHVVSRVRRHIARPRPDSDRARWRV